MDMLIRAAAAAAIGAVLALLIRKNSPETALLLSLAVALLVVFMATSALERIRDFITSLSDTTSIEPAVISAVLKTAGISVVAKIAADVCRDAGQAASASAVELCGAAAALYVALPLMETVVRAVEELV